MSKHGYVLFPQPAVLAWLTAHWLTRGRVRLVWPLSLQLNSSSRTAVNINEHRVSSIWDRVLDAVPVLLCSQRAPHHQPVPATSPCCPWCLAAAWSLRVYVVSANQSFINQTADPFVSQCDHGYHSKKNKNPNQIPALLTSECVHSFCNTKSAHNRTHKPLIVLQSVRSFLTTKTTTSITLTLHSSAAQNQIHQTLYLFTSSVLATAWQQSDYSNSGLLHLSACATSAQVS